MAKRRKDTATVDIKIRMKEPLRADIERAAKRRGISMNAEMVDRLERSLDIQNLVSQALEATYGPKVAGLIQVIARAMNDTGSHAGFASTFTREGALEWFKNPYAFNRAVEAVDHALGRFRPPGEIVEPAVLDGAKDSAAARILAPLYRQLGEGFVGGLVEALRGRGATAELKSWAKPVREQLGDLVETLDSSVSRKGKDGAL